MLIITGSLAYDYLMDFPGKFSEHILPDQLHKINLSFTVNKFAKRRGGTAGNVSYSLALLDTPQILLSVGGKDFAEYARDFEKLSIDTSNILLDDEIHTATGFAMTDQTNNQIWGFFNGLMDKSRQLQLETVAKKGDLVFVGPQGAKGAMAMVQQCIKLAIPFIFDPGFMLTDITDEDLSVGLTNASMISANDYEINLIKKRIPDYKKVTKNKIIITTLGEHGALIEKGNDTFTIKPAKPKKVVDPTGAGDAWRSGFLAGLERGFDLQTCGQMGAIAATYAIEHYGTQEHTYTKRQFTKRYKETYNQSILL
jgi:adenosine kinase